MLHLAKLQRKHSFRVRNRKKTELLGRARAEAAWSLVAHCGPRDPSRRSELVLSSVNAGAAKELSNPRAGPLPVSTALGRGRAPGHGAGLQ